MFSNEIRPYQSHADHCYEPRDTFHIPQMRVLDIESGRFHRPEESLDLPTLLIRLYGVLRMIEAYKNLKFRNTPAVFESCAREVNVFSFQKIKFVIDKFFPKSYSVEEMPCPYPFSGFRIDYPEVLPDADIVTDSHGIEPSDPFLSDELPVSDKTIHTVISEQSSEPFHKFFAFSPFRVASFGHEAEYKRECYSLICNSKHEDIDVEVTELPVCPVHAEHQLIPDGEQREYHPCYQIEIQRILGEKPLETAHIGISFCIRRHGGSQLMETDGLNHAKCVDEQRHKFYTGKIHRFFKMLLHNREDLVNFDRVLEISSFHEKKRPNFSFKLLIFRDFCKYNYLKFNCLTA